MEEEIYITERELEEILRETKQQLLNLYNNYQEIKKKLWEVAHKYALLNLYFDPQWCNRVGTVLNKSSKYIEKAIDTGRLSENIIEDFVKYERHLQHISQSPAGNTPANTEEDSVKI
jgi:hypothetical protein